jgi:hypothetical protein
MKCGPAMLTPLPLLWLGKDSPLVL